MRLLLAAGIPALLVAACAATPSARNLSYNEELEQLRAECTARGGILQAISDTITANARADYACRLQDPPATR